jgi:hypothetical protein
MRIGFIGFIVGLLVLETNQAFLRYKGPKSEDNFIN